VSPPDRDEPDREIGESVELTHSANCAHHASLYGMAGTMGPSVGPITVDTTGTDICLSLDARDNIWIAHFAASTGHEQGASSSFQLGLYDANGDLIANGWDVNFSSSTRASIEHGIEKGQLVDVVLWVRAKSGTATSTVSLYLFEPYE
jgi:hypothetical protein